MGRRVRFELGDGISALERPGDGETVVWVHGYTTDASLWEEIWEHLPGWRHIGMDLPGHGLSRQFGQHESLGGLARRLADSAAELGARHIVGLSLGTIVALEMILQRRETFASLTLGAPAVGGGPSDEGARLRFQQLEAAYRLLGAGPWLREMWMTSPPKIFDHALRRPELRAKLEKVIGAHSWRELGSGNSITRVASDAQDLSQLDSLDIDILLIVGEYDLDAYCRTADIIASRTPNAHIEVLENVGHACLLEAPKRCAELIESHFRSSIRRKPTPG